MEIHYINELLGGNGRRDIEVVDGEEITRGIHIWRTENNRKIWHHWRRYWSLRWHRDWCDLQYCSQNLQPQKHPVKNEPISSIHYYKKWDLLECGNFRLIIVMSHKFFCALWWQESKQISRQKFALKKFDLDKIMVEKHHSHYAQANGKSYRYAQGCLWESIWQGKTRF